MKILQYIKFAFFSMTVHAIFFACQTNANVQEYPAEMLRSDTRIIQAPVGTNPQANNPINGWGFSVAPANVPTDLVTTLLNITNFILGFAAMIATLVIIYGGIVYLTSLGNDSRTDQAKKIISSGIIGLIIIGLAYAIVIIVINILMT